MILKKYLLYQMGMTPRSRRTSSGIPRSTGPSRETSPNRYGGVPIQMVESLDLSTWRVPSWTDIAYVANEFVI